MRARRVCCPLVGRAQCSKPDARDAHRGDRGAARRLRFTGAQIAELLRMLETTVSGMLRRIGLGHRGRLGLEPAQRY
jgi:transposase InsO family protein